MGQLSKLKMLIDEREKDLNKTLSDLNIARKELS